MYFMVHCVSFKIKFYYWNLEGSDDGVQHSELLGF
jgi:hypothetical protein